MRILVAGSHGLIGSALVDRMIADGHSVLRLVRARGATGPPAASEAVWEPEGQRIEAEALEGLDAAVNLAGEPLGARRWSSVQRRKIVDSRVKGTAFLSKALADLEHPPSALVSGSAIGYYGDRGDEPLTEDSAPGEGFLAELCQQWEAATSVAEERGIRVVHLRTGIVLSRRGGALAKQLPLFRLGLGGRLGSGAQFLSWISLADQVGAIATAIRDSSLSGPINCTAPEAVTNAVFTKALARALGRPAILPVPRWAMELALGQDMARETALVSQRVLPSRLLDLGYGYLNPTLDSGLEAALSE